jgi:hypothetical protein
VISLLSQSMTSADHWLEYMRRRCEAEGVTLPSGTDTDLVRVPGGWNFSSEPLHNIYLPVSLVPGTPGVRFHGGQAYIQVTRSEAKQYLSRPAIAELNRELAQQLAGTGVQPTDTVTVIVPAEIGATVITTADGRSYHTKIENGRAVVHMPADAARDLLNSGQPCCVAWHRENAFLAARIGSTRAER